MIGRGFLVQRHTDAPDHRAENLAARDGLRMRPAATALTTRVPNDAELLIDLDLGKHGRVRAMRVFAVHSARRWLFFDPVGLAGPHHVGHRDFGSDHPCAGSCLRQTPHHRASRRRAATRHVLRQPWLFLHRPTGAQMAEPTDEVVNDPPSTGASGSAESPSCTVTFSKAHRASRRRAGPSSYRCQARYRRSRLRSRRCHWR